MPRKCPSSNNALRAVERGLLGRAGAHGARRRHPEALLVRPTVGVDMQVARGLVRPGEPGADHHIRRPGRQCQSDVSRMADATVGPDVLAQAASLLGALEHRAELRAADTGAHPGRAHRPRSDTDLDDVGPGFGEIPYPIGGDDVARHDRHGRLDRPDDLQASSMRS